MGHASSPQPSNSTKPLINLLRGWPAASLLPVSLVQKASEHVLGQSDAYIPGLEYGPDPGDPRARKALAMWLQSFYGMTTAIDHERITMTGGASQSLGVMLAVLTDPLYTRAAWMSSPSYFLAFRIFQDAGFAPEDERLRGVREDEEGMDVAWLKKQLVACDLEHENRRKDYSHPRQSFKHGYAKLFRHVIYVVPSFSNPTSRTMSLARRQELIRVAREHDALIVCDDVYDMLFWQVNSNTEESQGGQSPIVIPRIVDVDLVLDGGTKRSKADGFGNAVSNGSFSKICGPGVRCGWVEAAPPLAYLVSQAGVQKSGGAPSQLTSIYMTELIESGELPRHITGTLIPAFRKRYQTMRQAISEHLEPLGVKLTQQETDVAGGYFLWLQLPATVKGFEVARRALEEENLVVARGEMFEVPHNSNQPECLKFPRAVRVCFAWEDESRLREGVQRLGAVVSRMLSGATSVPSRSMLETRSDHGYYS